MSVRDPRVTEQRNPRTAAIDLASPLEIVALMNAEDRAVADAVATQRERIAEGIAEVEAAFRRGGRLFYCGAGTSGRLGVLDASECPPTFGVDFDLVQGFIAGGDAAMFRAQEGAEDSPEGGARDVDARGVRAGDVLCGIAASGTTPYVRGALARGRAVGARTLLVACSPPPEATLAHVDVAIVPVTGPEVVTGSTRLKAGTATKMVLNMLTTGAMIRVGKTYGNLMVDLRATNAKLVDRSERIVMEVCGVDRDAARALLEAADRRVKLAIVMHKLGATRDEAERALAEAGGVIRRVVSDAPPARGRVTAPGAPPSRPTDDRAPAPDVFVGLMSGTSADGVSAAAARFHPRAGDPARLDVELLGFVQLPYAAERRERLLAAMQSAAPRDYCRLHAELGHWLADAAAALLAESGIARAEVRAVASHGQTIWHEPGHSTWQLGDASVIAERLGVDVVSDLRVRDVAAGGQGAPLVPVADALLFAAPDRWRALQNLGGIGNVTVVPPAVPGSDPFAGVRAFDTGPGCAVIDALARRARPELPYDVDGRLARAGRPVDAVVDALLAEPYFLAPPPKSTGRELFSAAYVDRLEAACRAARPDATDADLVATAVSLTARSVADAYARFLPEPVGEVLLSGGGARNPALAEAIVGALAERGLDVPVGPFDAACLDGEAKEAVAFALLGYLHVHRRAGNVPGATGARGPRVLGALTPGAAPDRPPTPLVAS